MISKKLSGIKKYIYFLYIYIYSIKMSEKTLKFGDVEVNKKEFHASIKCIPLNLVDTNQVVISDKFKHSDKTA